MRCLSPAKIKSSKLGPPLQIAPRDGTYLREVYDALQANKGRATQVDFRLGRTGAAIAQLENFYGLDIRCLQKGSSRTGRPSLYVLAGEWFGRVYIDYVAEVSQ